MSKNVEMGDVGHAESLLKKLFHLKRYETPETSRMTRNKQNIMRHVREAHRDKRKTFGELFEVQFPWFFAEPKYGVAILFIAFAGLNYLGTNARNAAHSSTGIYTTTDRYAAYQHSDNIATNPTVYAEIPDNWTLFPQPQGNDDVGMVVREWVK